MRALFPFSRVTTSPRCSTHLPFRTNRICESLKVRPAAHAEAWLRRTSVGGVGHHGIRIECRQGRALWRRLGCFFFPGCFRATVMKITYETSYARRPAWNRRIYLLKTLLNAFLLLLRKRKRCKYRVIKRPPHLNPDFLTLHCVRRSELFSVEIKEYLLTMNTSVKTHKVLLSLKMYNP